MRTVFPRLASSTSRMCDFSSVLSKGITCILMLFVLSARNTVDFRHVRLAVFDSLRDLRLISTPKCWKGTGVRSFALICGVRPLHLLLARTAKRNMSRLHVVSIPTLFDVSSEIFYDIGIAVQKHSTM